MSAKGDGKRVLGELEALEVHLAEVGRDGHVGEVSLHECVELYGAVDEGVSRVDVGVGVAVKYVGRGLDVVEVVGAVAELAYLRLCLHGSSVRIDVRALSACR